MIIYGQNEVINSDKKSIILMTGDSMSRPLIPLANQFYKRDDFDFISFYQSSTLSPPIPFDFETNLNTTYKKIKDQEFYLQNVIEYVDKEI